MIEDEDTIIILDNGIGMDQSEINNKYLMIGYQKRRDADVNTQIYKRHVMGRKGVGNLSVFSVAEKVEIHTVKNGEVNGFRMGMEDIDRAIDTNATEYQPSLINLESIHIVEGTKIILTRLKQPTSEIEKDIKSNIAHRFTVLGKANNFRVYVDGSEITAQDHCYYNKLQYVWSMGISSKILTDNIGLNYGIFDINNIVDIDNDFVINGWVGTTKKPSDIDKGQHTIALYAHGKLVQEDILADYNVAGVYGAYLVGEIRADFLDLDDENDIVTTNRQKINQNDPRYKSLKEFILKEILGRISKEWTSLRNTDKQSKNSQAKTSSDNSNTIAQNNGNQISSQENTSDYRDRPDNTEEDNNNDPLEDDFFRDISSQSSKSPPKVLKDIKELIELSKIDKLFKEVAIYDLKQAVYAYRSGAYKACVVMLGAVLEGVMVGTLARPEMKEKILNDPDPANELKRMGGAKNAKLQDMPTFIKELSNLPFRDYKMLIERYIPDTKSLGVEDIQHFRNGIHPGVVIGNRKLYGRYNVERAMTFIGSLHTLTSHILAWEP